MEFKDNSCASINKTLDLNEINLDDNSDSDGGILYGSHEEDNNYPVDDNEGDTDIRLVSA